MERKFEEILDGCLERILQGESIEECLRSYPERAGELEPLLRVALLTSKASSIEPRTEFKAAARYRLEGALKAREERQRKPFLWILGWSRGWVAAVATLLVVFLVGSGTVWASSSSLPGDPLYQVKLATEQVQSTFTFSQMSKAKLQVALAEKRVNEMTQLAEKNSLERMEELIPRLAAHLEKVERLAPTPLPIPAPALMSAVHEEDAKRGAEPEGAGIALSEDAAELKTLLEVSAQRNLSALQGVLEKAPLRAKPAINSSLERLRQHYEKTIQAFGGNDMQDDNTGEVPGLGQTEPRGR